MRFRLTTILAITVLFSAATVSWADLGPYSENFEGLDATSPTALGYEDDNGEIVGWKVFGNAFFPDGNYWFGYGPFPAPNGTPGFSSVAVGQGGPDQGAQQLVVYADYNFEPQGGGAFSEANIFQEQVMGAADIGTTWRFGFDAKRGDIAGGSIALAFYKVIDPVSGFLTAFIPLDTTNLPTTWSRYSLDVLIPAAWEGQLLQLGFLAKTNFYQPSGVLYDNVEFGPAPIEVALDIRPGGCPNPVTGNNRGVIPAAILGTADFDVADIDVSTITLEGVAPVQTGYGDVATPFDGALCGCTSAGMDGNEDLNLKFSAQDIIAVIGSARGERVLRLTGALLDGTPIEAADCMIVVGGGRSGESDGDILGSNGTGEFQQISTGGDGPETSRGTSRDQTRGRVRRR